ncbi:hypothetical protein TRVL_10167 [Trypanosoma vivax]|nr:hypothetical protein TRVL_10167 [Trypanosoma vivax]
MRKRVREADSLSKAICFNVPLDEARMGSLLHSTPPAGLQWRRSCRESSAARADNNHNEQQKCCRKAVSVSCLRGTGEHLNDRASSPSKWENAEAHPLNNLEQGFSTIRLKCCRPIWENTIHFADYMAHIPASKRKAPQYSRIE